MRRPRLLALGVVALLLAPAAPARAGMPVVTLNDLARMRFQAISFFLVVLLASAWGIQKIWNGLRADVPRLPRLHYRAALGLTALWGLLFLLVLSMISGARELMTPGAWTKKPNGLTYTLADAPRSDTPQPPPSPPTGPAAPACSRSTAACSSTPPPTTAPSPPT